MASPIKQITHAFSNPLDTASSILGRAFTPPGIGSPAIPPPLPPAQTPSAKPQRKSQQQSFLSGVAAAGLPGGGGGSQTGKSLLGS